MDVGKVTRTSRQTVGGRMLQARVLLMIWWICIFGGLLIMMGHHARSEALFSGVPVPNIKMTSDGPPSTRRTVPITSDQNSRWSQTYASEN